MTVYVMSYFTQASFDAELDDPSFGEMSLADHASPEFARVAGRFSDAWLERCKREVEDDVREAYMEEPDLVSELTWRTEGWQELGWNHELGYLPRSNQVFHLHHPDGEVAAAMVIQRVELDEEAYQ